MFPLLLLLAAAPVAKSEPAELKTPTGALFGTLDLPAGAGPWPVVLIHPGSGPTDRDGNSALAKNDSLKLLGQALAAKGIACLRIDKRGIGASAKAMTKEDDLTINTYADDAAAWVKQLRADKRFTKVGFVGHSEGALIGELAGQATRFDALVSLCGTGRLLSDVLREQLKGKLDALAETNEAILKALEAGKKVADVPKELRVLYRPSVQPYLISVFRLDPAVLVAKLKCPVLVVRGTADIQVSAADFDRLAKAKPGVETLTVKNMTHVLKLVSDPKGRAEQMKTYTDPALPIAPALVEGTARFLVKALGGAKRVKP
jgi:pimeloyl-ACP methyl ester carboxylesterase